MIKEQKEKEPLETMQCVACGADAMKRTEGNFKHKALGLSNVTLVNVVMYKCDECGEVEVEIPSLAELQKAIAMMIITKKSRLVGEEVRYLRKFLGWSGVMFAKHFGVAAETISRWENDKEAIGPTADRLLRMSTRFISPIESYVVEDLLDAMQQDHEAKPMQLRLREMNDRWAEV